MSTWMWIAGSFLLGALAGVFGTLLVRRGNEVEQRMRRLRREFDQYQGEVGRHFSQTAEVLTRLRSDFTQLYHHTERGASQLVGEEALQRRLRELENAEGRNVTPTPERLPTTEPVVHGSVKVPMDAHADPRSESAVVDADDDEAGPGAERG